MAISNQMGQLQASEFVNMLYSLIRSKYFLNLYSAVTHHDDLLYLFHVPPLAPLYSSTDPEMTITKRMIQMFVNFAKTG